MEHEEQIAKALEREGDKFQTYFRWLDSAMPSAFFDQVGQTNAMLVVHNLMEFEAQGYFVAIQLRHMAIVVCLDAPDADLQVLKNYTLHGIESYQAYISKTPPPFLKISRILRVVVIHFFTEDESPSFFTFPSEEKEKLRQLVKAKYPLITSLQFETAFAGISPPFIQSLTMEHLVLAIGMYVRATMRDHCQYEVNYLEDWEKNGTASMNIIFAWRNVPKHNFLYRLLRTIYRHDLIVDKITASYHDLYRPQGILVVALDLHGANGRAVWEVASISDFVKELIATKYFASFDAIDHYLVNTGVVSGNMGNILRSMVNFVHQVLVNVEHHLFTLESIEEALCRHPELTAQLCEAFKFKFDPEHVDLNQYKLVHENFLRDVERLDTGQEENDMRRKHVLRKCMLMIHYTLKTNFYRSNYTSLSFRLDPKYLDEIPFDRPKKFPELPYGIFFIKGMHFFGFHIRFRDLARGGVRTVMPEHRDKIPSERANVFTECYNLAYTQQMKNKDIPEGGAKAIIFLQPYERLEAEAAIFKKELQASRIDPVEIERKLDLFRQEQKLEHLYQAQRSFIESLIPLVNCHASGRLKEEDIIDYWNKPEYLYLGPDENMHDVMIQWIAEYSKKQHYKPGGCFISGKPEVGINHKAYGVTSLGVNVYMEELLRYLKIDPTKDRFTVKMSGGPDGDVAGNQICNLQRYYPNTAKVVALTDISGTIFDPEGLDLNALSQLFLQGKSIRFYPPAELHDGAFLVDKSSKRFPTPLVQQTLCWRKREGKLEQDWLSGSDMNHLFRHNVHQTPADIFIPAGGRPRTLNENNWTDFLDPTGRPTSRAIVEGANLYLDQHARHALEKLGVLIIKDSSANKTGVICSSFEVLSGLALGDDQFVANKGILVKEIQERLRLCAQSESSLLLRTHKETDEFLTNISDKISRHINLFTDQLLEYLEPIKLSNDPNDPLIRCFLGYCLPCLRTKYEKELLHEIPDAHKKAIIASHIASRLVYTRGLSWFPSVVDILPVILVE